jgi:hypothetical protein
MTMAKPSASGLLPDGGLIVIDCFVAKSIEQGKGK